MNEIEGYLLYVSNMKIAMVMSSYGKDSNGDFIYKSDNYMALSIVSFCTKNKFLDEIEDEQEQKRKEGIFQVNGSMSIITHDELWDAYE